MTMPKITIEHRKYYGGVCKITEDVYEIPKSIFCHNTNCRTDDGHYNVMEYNSDKKAYICPCCGNFIAARDYLKKELRASVENLIDANINTSNINF